MSHRSFLSPCVPTKTIGRAAPYSTALTTAFANDFASARENTSTAASVFAQ